MQNEKATSEVIVNGEQAKQELSVLEARANKLKTALIEANKAGDGTAYTKLSKELKSTQKEMNQLAKESFDVKKVLNDLSGATMKDLLKAQRQLNSEINNGSVKRGTEDWKKHQEQLKAVKTEIAAINSETSIGATGAEKFSGGFRQMFAGAMAGIAALTGVYLALKKFMDLRMQLEDSQANLKALTGLEDNDIKWLTDYAKELSTTTTEAGVRITASSKEIMDGFTVIGSKRPELLKNKEAMAEVTKQALTLAAAGKMDVKEAFEAVTASMNQFNLGADQSRRIINVLGAGALEGSAEINDLSGSMKNVGTVAANSNMTLEQTIAALEVLASKQLLGEEAGTKLRGALLKMKEAGVGYVSGAFNMRDAIVEINGKLKDKSTALERDAYMQKVFGIENITAGMILLDNVKSYDYLTKAITDTTVAEKQAGINTDTTSAKLKQATNNFNEAGMALVTNLEPAMLTTVNAGVKLVNLFIKYPALAIAIISAVGLLTIAYLANTVAMMANALWVKLVAEATALANTQTALFFRTLMSNPYVAIATAVGAIALTLSAFVSKTKEAITAQSEHNRIMDEATKKTGEEEIKLNSLRKILNDSTKSYTERKNALDEIQKIVPEYHASLTKEGVLINNNSDALEIYVQKLKISAQMQLATTNLVNAQDEQRKYVQENKDALLEIMKIRMKASELMASGKYEDMDHALSAAGLGAGYKGIIEGLDIINNKVKVYDELVSKYAGDLSKIKPKVVKPENLPVGGNKPTVEAGNKSNPYEDELKKAEEGHKKIVAQRKDFYANDKSDEEDYQAWMYIDELAFLNNKLKLQKKYGLSTVDTEIAISDLLIAEKKRLKSIENKVDKETEKDKKDAEKERLKLIKEVVDLEDKYGINAIENLKTKKKLELDIAKAAYKQGIIDLKTYLKLVKTIESEYELPKWAKDTEKIAGGISDVADKFSKTLQGFQSAEEKSIETKYQKQIDAANKAGQDTTAIEQKKNDELAALRSKNADYEFDLQIASITASTAEAAINAYASAIKVPVIGPVLAPIAAAAAVAYGISQIAVANSAKEAAKAGYSNGGFTPEGDKYQPAGIVHAGEFVANQEAVRSVPLRKFFNLIDYAQKTNTIARIDNDAIARALSIKQGFSSGSFAPASPGSGENQSIDISSMVAAVNRSNAVNEALLAELRKGIVATAKISGNNGIAKGIEDYNKLVNNAKG